MRLWDWAVQAYGPAEVQTLCLDLQDNHGQCAPFLLWAAWASVNGGPPEGPVLAKAAELARFWESHIGRPLRASRRALKRGIEAVDGEAREALRARLKAVDLAAERLLLDSLEGLTPSPARDVRPQPVDLSTAVEAYGAPAPAGLLRELAERLTQGLVEPTAILVYDRPDGGHQMDDSQDPEDAGIRARIAVLKIEHQDLDAAVAALAAMSVPDMVQIARLKKKKLALRDQIAGLEDQLMPDIIA